MKRFGKTALVGLTVMICLAGSYALLTRMLKGDTPTELVRHRLLYTARPEPGGTVYRDIVYRKGLLNRQKLDIYMPIGTWDSSSRNLPAVLFIHGGSWMHGSKEDIRIIDRFVGKMRNEGWALIAIDYVAGPLGLLDAPSTNVRRALTWVREHADEYGIDSENIGLYSVSAGSHLTLGALNRADTPGNNWRFWLSECGPVDLVAMADGEAYEASELFSRFPTWYLRKHSPGLYVNTRFPPTAIVHGDADQMVALAQSERLAETLSVYGTDVTLKVISGGDHGFFGNSQAEWMDMEDDFIPFMRHHFKR